MSDWQDFLNDLKRSSGLPDVAKALGMPISRARSEPATLCPFHDDHTPSLRLYPDHFHCYACQKHGDVYSLIREVRKCGFREAVEWLASQQGRELPKVRRDTGRDEKARLGGLAVALSAYRSESAKDKEILADFAASRGFSVEFLRQANAHGARGGKLTARLGNDREAMEALLEDGLVRSHEESALRLPGYYDTFWQDRVVFPLCDETGMPKGFVGRAMDSKAKCKYFFTKGLPKSKLLFRLDSLRRAAFGGQASDEGKPYHLFVTEGLMDALRLESLGYHAVAVLGSRISNDQANLIRVFGEDLEKRANQTLFVHLFLDADEAGRKGVTGSLKMLWCSSRSDYLPPTDVIIGEIHTPQPKPKDPDDLLKELNPPTAGEWLAKHCRSAIGFLVSEHAEADSEQDLESAWDDLPPPMRIVAVRRIANLLPTERWGSILARARPFDVFVDEAESVSEKANWRRWVESYLCPDAPGTVVVTPIATPALPELGDRDSTALMQALALARATNERRELPLDVGSWDRIEKAADVFFRSFEALLQSGKHIHEEFGVPFVAARIPKGADGYRLKASPCPEALIVQHYMLCELVRARSAEFYAKVPAVRSIQGVKRRVHETTGCNLPMTESGAVQSVSFAYQIDSAVVRGEVPGRTGMFRPYYHCWRDFIAYLDEGLSQLSGQRVKVVRLDIRRFYDSLPRHAVRDALYGPLFEALKSLDDSTSCAPLFCPDIRDEGERAALIVDWLCDESFNYPFLDPSTGRKQFPESPTHGIPQGPDLSAYLANIALFALDSAVATYVAKVNSEAGHLCVRYGRYVDDFIIISDRVEHIESIRALIEEEIGGIGLELGGKTTVEPWMRKDEARAWLTNARGGLGISVRAELLATTLDSLLDDCAEAGHTERREALTILQGTDMFSPSVAHEEALYGLRAVTQADDLRFNDICAVSEGIWRLVLRSDVREPGAIPKAYWHHWSELVNDRKKSDDLLGRVDSAHLACLDGIERVLCIRRDRSPAYGDKQRKRLSEQRSLMAQCVAKMDSERALFAPSEMGELSEKITFSSRLKWLVVLREVAVILANQGNASPDSTLVSQIDRSVQRTIPSTDLSAAELGLLASLHTALNGSTAVTSAARAIQDPSILTAMHLVSALLGTPNVLKGTEDILAPLAPLMQQVDGQLRSAFTDRGAAVPLFDCLHAWRQANDTSDTADADSRDAALKAFVNLVPHDFLAPALSQRGVLCSHLFPSDMRVIPSPPGISYPGLFARTADCQRLGRVDLIADACVCGSLLWEEDTTVGPGSNWKRYVTTLDEAWQTLSDYARRRTDEGQEVRFMQAGVGLCAQLCESLIECKSMSEDNPPVLTGDHILVRVLSGNEDEPLILSLLAYRLPSDQVGSTAFIHSGDGLVPEALPVIGSEYWEVGTVLADGFGMLEYSMANADLRLTARPFVARDDKYEWACETMLRAALFRLRGVWISKSGVVKSRQSCQATVRRAVDSMAEFSHLPSEDANSLVTWVRDSMAENRAIAMRLQEDVDYSMPGGVVLYLQRLGRDFACTDDKLCDEPVTGMPPVFNPPLRRPVEAFLRIGMRYQTSLADLEGAKLTGMRAVAAGLAIHAVSLHTRMQALELLSALPDKHLRKLVQEDLPLVDLGVSEDALLIACDVESQSESLLELVRAICLPSSGENRVNDLEDVTPLGWGVLLAWIVGVGPDQKHRGVGLGDHEGCCMAEDELVTTMEALSILCQRFAEVGEGEEFPWYGIAEVAHAWTMDRASEMLRILGEFDRLAQMTVSLRRDSLFSTKSLDRQGRFIISTPEGRRTLPLHQFTHSRRNQRDMHRESCDSPEDGEEQLSVWTETVRHGKRLGYAVVSQEIADLAGLGASAERQDSPEASAKPSTRPTPAGAEPAKMRHVDSNEIESRPEDGGGEYGSAKRPPATSGQKDGPDFSHTLAQLRLKQVTSWKLRQKEPHHGRIALLQFDVDDSYRHPIVELCSRIADKKVPGGHKALQNNPEIWTESLADMIGLDSCSCSEFRRRRIIEQAVKACGELRVELLLLPEYSVRPDTVIWLRNFMEEEHIDRLSVWAGTFRVPAYHNLLKEENELVEWGAHLPVVWPVDGTIKMELKRRKKYPAQAFQEVFAPPESPFDAIANMAEWGDLRDDVLELICAEMFLITSPSNVHSLTRASMELRRRFTGAKGGEWSDYLDQAMKDIDWFARSTTFVQEQRGARRSIILCPAFTSRTVDYAITGQAGYLAAGLTTVFCNAVNAMSHGQSCFIGTDCWDIATQPDPTMPGQSPYHGVLPGVYRQFSASRGFLGEKEQALVVCDVDPTHTFGGKPRPESLGSSLKLVAHLPIIESWGNLEEDGKAIEGGCRCERSRIRRDLKELGNLFSALNDHIAQDLPEGSRTTVRDASPQNLADILKELAKHTESKWLRRRGEAYQAQHANDPQPWPPPTSLDWIWVDLGNPKEAGRWPFIEIPPFSIAPGESASDTISTTVRDD